VLHWRKNSSRIAFGTEGAQMLTQIRFSNYRAFEKGHFRLKPITIFVGANSVGKTSLLQLLLILKQTASIADQSYKAALKIHGREVNIGDPRNFFFNQAVDKDFEIEIWFNSQELLDSLRTKYFTEFSEYIYGAIHYYDFVLQNHVSGPKSTSRFAKNFRPLTSKEPYTDKELEGLLEFVTSAGELVSKLPAEKLPVYGFRHLPAGATSAILRRRLLAPIEPPITVYASDIERTHRFLTAIMKAADGPEFCYSAKISLTGTEGSAKYLRVNEVALSQRRGDIIRLHLKDGSLQKITSNFCEDKYVDNYQKTLDKALNPSSTIFSLFSADRPLDGRYQFPEFIRSILFATQTTVASNFEEDRLGHIGPLRAYPKRFYFLDVAQAGTTDGDLLVEALRENEELRVKVNAWLRRFGIDITVRQLEEIIYRLSVRSKDHNFDLDITDVGFGISQVLPILVEGFVSSMGKIILIEQPEIHLHPKMQGELADLFIDIANLKEAPIDGIGSNRRYLFIETHSEYLLSRLRRRIAEGAIRHSDVALYFVERAKAGGGSVVRGSYMPADGAFEWPEEFFEEDLKDTLLFLKSSMKKRTETPLSPKEDS
jgi:predicted ATPase